MKLKLFVLDRRNDESGVSGIGYVACGIIFPNGWCALSWNTEFTSVAVYPNIETLIKIHGHGGKTVCYQILDYDQELVTRLMSNFIQNKCEGVGSWNQLDPNGKYFGEEREKFAGMFESKQIV